MLNDSYNFQDVLDVGEKFDRLQIERMSQEDPDSLPFYNARKNTERKKVVQKKAPLLKNMSMKSVAA